MAASNGLQGIHVRGHAEGVDNEKRACSGCDGSLDRRRIKVERDGVDVGEYGRGANLQHGVGDCDEAGARLLGIQRNVEAAFDRTL